jgi:hypothetical protein
MDINTLFPSDYLKAADFPSPRVLTIRGIGVEEIGDEKTAKPVLHFMEEQRGLVLNKTNSGLIAHSLGNETDAWIGRQLELYKEPVSFQGRIVDAIRVRVAITAPTAQPAPVAATPAPTVRPAPAAAPAAQEAFVQDDINF